MPLSLSSTAEAIGAGTKYTTKSKASATPFSAKTVFEFDHGTGFIDVHKDILFI